MGFKLSDTVQQLLQSRLALVLVGIGVPALLVAALVRLIPWKLFLLILVLGVVGLVIFILVRQWWAMRKDRRLEEGLDAQTSKDIGHRRVKDRKDLKDLQEQWKKSVEALRRSKIGRQRRPLYFLPWYAIIGAPASGKTTAIQQSGLSFTVGDGKAKLKGVGGTKNCDWFFADEAIILDTAGRYTFGEESVPDRDEWLEFLKLLRKYRPREPLNGLIVAVPATLLMSEDRDEVVTYGSGIRTKIDEIVRELGIQFPVYILVTKCDLIEGFTEFFGRLPKKRLDELLGWTNPSWERGEPRALVKTALDEFRARVLAMRTTFLQEEERPEALRKIFLFPGELEAFEANLAEFCEVLFRETQFNESAFLRGVYLTSGMQTGTAVSRMLDRLGLRAQATELREERRSFFLKDFFKSRLPSDRRLVATTGRTRGHLQIVHNLGLVSAALVFVVLTVITAGSYVANRTLLNNLQDETRLAVGPQQSPPPERVQALTRYTEVLERLQFRNERRPWYTGLGLDTGDRAFRPARDLFVRQFGTYDYVPPIEAARRALRERDADRGFPGLDAVIRDYQLSRQFNGRSPSTSEGDAPEPIQSLLLFWAGGQLPPDDLQKAYGRTYIDFLRWRDPANANAEQERDLVLLREALPEMFTVDRVAAWVGRFYRPVRAEDVRLPPALANGAVVPGGFTVAALGERVKPLTDTVNELDPELTRRFRREYVDRYLTEWFQFLMRPKESADGMLPVDTLLGEQTPYLALIDRAATETAIGVSQPPGWARVVAQVSAQRAAYVGYLQAIARDLATARTAPALALDAAKKIYQAPALPVGNWTGDGAAPADDFGKAEYWAIATTGAGTPADGDEIQMRARLSTLLRVPVYAAFGAYLQMVHGEINRQWNTMRGTTRDPAALYSKPGGIVWQFYTLHLDPFLDSISYTPKTRYTKTLPVSASLGTMLRKGEKIGQACIPGRRFKIVFDTLPTTDPPGGDLRVTRTVLNIYCGEGAPWTLEHRQYHKSGQLLWAPDACGRVELQVYVGTPGGGLGEERQLGSKVYEGLPDFLREARQSGNEYVWPLENGVSARFEISAPQDIFLCMQAGSPPASL